MQSIVYLSLTTAKLLITSRKSVATKKEMNKYETIKIQCNLITEKYHLKTKIT